MAGKLHIWDTLFCAYDAGDLDPFVDEVIWLLQPRSMRINSVMKMNARTYFSLSSIWLDANRLLKQTRSFTETWKMINNSSSFIVCVRTQENCAICEEICMHKFKLIFREQNWNSRNIFTPFIILNLCRTPAAPCVCREHALSSSFMRSPCSVAATASHTNKIRY